MFTTLLPVGAAALLVSVACWGVGSALVSSRSPIVALLAGWCAFLFLCLVAWIVGLSAAAIRPAFLVFFLVGLWFMIRRQTWLDFTVALLCTAAIAYCFCYPFLTLPGLVAYGAHGLDMWGYVNTAEWLQHHSIRELPDVGNTPMRFNWTWYVFTIHDRPLAYVSLACLGSATGLAPVLAYIAYPVSLLASVAMALAREPGIFRLRARWGLLAVPVAIVIAFHPLLVLPWIAGYFGGTIVAPCLALAFAAVAVTRDRPQQVESLVWATLMLVLCGPLYTPKLALVGLALGAGPLLWFGWAVVRRDGWRGWRKLRPSPPLVAAIGLMMVVGSALFVFSEDLPVSAGEVQTPSVAVAHTLNLFGGTSPYVWLGYQLPTPYDREPLANPVGLAALVAMVLLFGFIAWREWRTAGDLRVPYLVALAAGVLFVSSSTEVPMARTLPLFGFTLLVLLAASARWLGHWMLALVAAAVCCLPAVRSAAEMRDMIRGPYITFHQDEPLADILDGQDWRVICYLAFHEDRDGLDWSKYPQTFRSVTVFLPMPARIHLAQKYGLPPPE